MTIDVYPAKNISSYLDVAMGNTPGQTTINKFGRNDTIASGVTADIWDNGATGGTLIWVAPTQARTHTIASTDVNDTSGGTGARTVKLYGLTSWSTSEVSETVTMDTASPPVTSNSYVIIYRMRVVTKGATNINIGTITATATSDGTVTTQINVGIGQTGMAIYGIPSTQKLYIGRFYGNLNKSGGASGGADLSMMVNFNPDVELINFVTRHTFGVMTSGTSALTINYYVPKIITGPAIIKIQATSGVNSLDISAGFDGIIVDN